MRMKTISQHLARVQQQPHHLRQKTMFAAAGIGTAIIALVWFIGSLATGAFAIQTGPIANEFTGATSTSNQQAKIPANSVAGAASAFSNTNNTPAHIEIVNTTPASSSTPQAEPTTIPF